MEIGNGSTVTASSKNTYSVECFGTIEANNGASVFAVSDKKDSDIFCSGAVINCGALVDAKVDVLGEIHKKSEN